MPACSLAWQAACAAVCRAGPSVGRADTDAWLGNHRPPLPADTRPPGARRTASVPAAYRLLDVIWLERKASYMEFPGVLK